MKKLNQSWITENHIDFEYKKYVLLSYLQDVHQDFEQTHLYPSMGDLVAHYRNVIKLKESKQDLFQTFPDRISGVDSTSFNLVFTKIIQDDDLMKELEAIIDYSIPEFEKYLNEGKKMFDFIEEKISIQPVGVLPINRGEGYIIVRNGDEKKDNVFEYQVTIFENSTEKYRGIYVNHLMAYEHSLAASYQSIKSDLIKSRGKLPNPATYAIESELTFPFEESLIPVAKRTFVKYLTENYC